MFTSVTIAYCRVFRPRTLVSYVIPALMVIKACLGVRGPIFAGLRSCDGRVIVKFTALIRGHSSGANNRVGQAATCIHVLTRRLHAHKLCGGRLAKSCVGGLIVTTPVRSIKGVTVPSTVLRGPKGLADRGFSVVGARTTQNKGVVQRAFKRLKSSRCRGVTCRITERRRRG